MVMKNWRKATLFFVIAVMCYAMVQIVYTISHMIAEEQNSIITEIIEHSVNLLWFALIFAPVIIFVLRSGLQNSKRIFLNFWKKHYIYYILYIAIILQLRIKIVQVCLLENLYMQVIPFARFFVELWHLILNKSRIDFK